MKATDIQPGEPTTNDRMRAAMRGDEPERYHLPNDVLVVCACLLSGVVGIAVGWFARGG